MTNTLLQIFFYNNLCIWQGAARLLETLGVGRGAGAGRGSNPQRAPRANHSTSLFPRSVICTFWQHHNRAYLYICLFVKTFCTNEVGNIQADGQAE